MKKLQVTDSRQLPLDFAYSVSMSPKPDESEAAPRARSVLVDVGNFAEYRRRAETVSALEHVLAHAKSLSW